MTNAGGSSAPGNKISYGQPKSNRLKSTSRMAATDKASGRRLMLLSSSLAVGQGCRTPQRSNTRSMTASRGLCMMQMHYFYEISGRVASIHQESEKVQIPETNPTYSCSVLHGYSLRVTSGSRSK